MLRFRNPGTQFSTQIQVIKQLYSSLGDQSSFSLEDMAIVIAQGNLMTAYGYAGDDALRLSNTDLDSMNSALMNAKMYAEVFRMLGWLTPYGKKSYPLVFTYIGIHVARSVGDSSPLYEQCVFGINNPTELTGRMRYNEEVRFFKCALRSIIDLGGIIYKHELSLGPMSVNDNNEEEYQAMLDRIRRIRGDYSRLHAAFRSLADSLGMQPTPVDNCTRLPIALMKSCNFVESITDTSLYNRSMVCLKITEYGIKAYNTIQVMKDIRLAEFNTYDRDHQKSLIRLGIYSMLERSGYNTSEVTETIVEDKNTCSEILGGKELLFSPCQTIRRTLIEEALGISIGEGTAAQNHLSTYESTVATRYSLSSSDNWTLSVSENPSLVLEGNDTEIPLIAEIRQLHGDGTSKNKIIETLFDNYVNSTQTTFYPLIATLFRIIGFNCQFSRPGDNGARWDAIIIDNSCSIPIEIKSPTEELFLSIKAIRQALENKIILLSRGTYPTKPEVTSLVVGYNLPNDRAEVSRLISDFKHTYGYKIGVIDLKSLLSISFSILVDRKAFNKEQLYSLEGLMNANI